MNEFYQELLEPMLYRWALSKESVKASKCSCQLSIENGDFVGTIKFHEDNLVELSIINRNTMESAFYLHFQLHDFKSSIEQFQSFFHYLQNNKVQDHNFILEEVGIKKILLSCSSGLTTSYFAYSMQEILNKQQINIQIDAIGYLEIEKMIDEYDLVLLAPQISYMYPELRKLYGNKILMMESYDFATSNFEGILEKVLH